MMEKHRHNQSNLYTNVDVPDPKTWEDIAMLTFHFKKRNEANTFVKYFRNMKWITYFID
jgi:hypothetical protein